MPPGAPGLLPPGMIGTPVAAGPTNSVITLVCRAVNLSGVDASANSTIAFAVDNEIKTSPLVDPKATQLSGQITLDDSNGTFTFTVNVTPINPLNF